MDKIEKLMNDIISIIEDKEGYYIDEYIRAEIYENKEEILDAIIEEIKERI